MKGHIITISEKRFRPERITIYEGEVITFQLEDLTSDIGQNEVYQVYRDRDSCLRVDGGFCSEQAVLSRGSWSQELNLARDYYFKCGNLPLLKVVVNPKPVHVVKVTDDGFSGAVIRLYKGETVRWSWKNCSEKHNITERKYCLEHGGYQAFDSRQEPMYTGSYFQTFNVPGIYFFKTQSQNEERAFCVVQVAEKFREHLLDVKDIGFTHALYEINSGDRVWLHWRQSKTNSTTSHSIMIKQICQLDNKHIEQPVIAEDSYPARPAGLFSHVFNNDGIYEILDGERPHLKCVLIVKPTPKQHTVKITKDEFAPGLGSVTQGDRIWWTWKANEMPNDFQLLRVMNAPTSPDQCCHSPENVFKTILRTVGVFSATLADFGLETFTASPLVDGNEKQQYCCLIAQPSSSHHEVKLKKTGFFPQTVSAKKGDIVWWKWTGTAELNGLEQINVSGEHQESLIDCPSQESIGAYMVRFENTGTFNFRSTGALNESHCMAVVVEGREEVVKVQVSPKGVKPDPVIARTGDIICWMWPRQILSSITEAKHSESEEEVFFSNRRCHSQQFNQRGVYHYTCVSLTPHDRNSEFAPDDVWSTVLVDTSVTETIVKNVDPAFLRQDNIHIVKGADILFTYQKPSEDVWQWSVVYMDNGDLVDIENLFIPNTGRVFSFKEVGTYQVNVNSKSGKYECLVNVANTEEETPVPEIVSSKNGGKVREGHTVYLSNLSEEVASNEDANVYYTTDGSTPVIGEANTHRYTPELGITLQKTGLSFIRAIAKMKGLMPSKALTSKRFRVMPPDYVSTTEASGDETYMMKPPKTSVQHATEQPIIHNVSTEVMVKEQYVKSSFGGAHDHSRPSTVEKPQSRLSTVETTQHREKSPTKSRPSTVEKQGDKQPKSRPSTVEKQGDKQPKSRPSTVEKQGDKQPKSRPSTVEKQGDKQPKSRPSTVEKQGDKQPKSRPSTVEKQRDEKTKSRPSTVGTIEKNVTSRPSTVEALQAPEEELEQQAKSRPSTSGRPNSRPSTVGYLSSKDEIDTPYVTIQKESNGMLEKRGKIVQITPTKFSPQNLVLHVGESLTFQLQPEAEHLIEHKIQQVFTNGQHVFPVTGGFHSDNKIQANQKWTQEFNCSSEYTFSFASHAPFKVIVKPKPVADLFVTDNGFSKPLLRVFKGDSVRWTWEGCSIQHTIDEVEYCLEHAGYKHVTTQQDANTIPSKTGSYIQSFSTPGVYYFLTQKKRVSNTGDGEVVFERDTCVVQVLKKKVEHLVELKDQFSTTFYELFTGERIWVKWRGHEKTPKSPRTHLIAFKKISMLKGPLLNFFFFFFFYLTNIYNWIEHFNLQKSCYKCVSSIKRLKIL